MRNREKQARGDANQRKERGYGRNYIPEELRIGAPGGTKGILFCIYGK